MRAFTLCLIGVLALGGCRSIWDPTFNPAGYSYHRNEFKSPPGPPAKDIGYAYTSDKNEQVQNEFREALRDLLIKAQAQNMPIPQTVALTTDLDAGAFQGTYDSLLREGLRANGHTLIDEKDARPDTPKLFYSAYGDKTVRQLKQGGPAEYNDDPQTPDDPNFMRGKRKMELVIGLVKNSHVLSKVSGLYDVQVYGYNEGAAAYVPGHERPVKQPPVTEFNQ